MMFHHQILPAVQAGLLLFAVLTPPVSAQRGDGVVLSPVPAPLAAEVPELGRHSVWGQDTTFAGEAPDQRERGVFAVGNGHVFAHCGLGARASTLQGLTGPDYATAAPWSPDGDFGDLTLGLDVDGRAVDLPQQRIRRILGAGFVVTEDASAQLALRTLTFAAPEARALTRIVEVHNLGDTPRAGLALRALRRGQGGRVRMSGDGAPGQIGALAAGAVWRGVVEFDTTGAGPVERIEGDAAFAAAVRAVRATLDWWQRKLAPTTVYDTDWFALRDLIADWKVNVLTLRCARTGVVVPMLHDKVASVRQSLGAMLLFLRFKMWDEAKALLEFFHAAARVQGRVAATVPLDLDLPGAAGESDWSAIEMPNSEIPSWLILLHHWYWRATRDTALIKAHWPLIDACLKKQRRGVDSLMAFSGREPFLGGALYDLPRAALGDDPLLVAHDPEHGREAWSLTSATLFLIAMQAVGELVDGLDRDAHPEKYADPETNPERPGSRYTKRTFAIMADIEKRFWITNGEYFAPAVSPVDGGQHRPPLANANLMPLWVGWTFPTGERSRDNLKNSLARLWRDGVRIGTTPTLGYATGDLQGMLLVALSERDAKGRLDVVESLVRLAGPAGEWAELYDPQGLPVGARDPAHPGRLQPGESGVNLDAILFALTGIRHASVPNWDNNDIRLKFRLPATASYFTVKDTAKDGRRLNLFFRRTRSGLDEKERKANDELVPEKRRDPDGVYERMRFSVDLLEGSPPKGYYDVALNAVGTVFVRYLRPGASLDGPDLRRIEDVEFWKEDDLEFLPNGPIVPTSPLREVARRDDAELLVLTCRNDGAAAVTGVGTTVFDTGLPFTLDDLAPLLLDRDGKPVHRRVLLDWNHDGGPPATFADPAVWRSGEWNRLLSRYRAAGGEVLAAEFVQDHEIEQDGRFVAVRSPTPRIALPAGDGERRVRFHLRASHARDVVLHLGTGARYTATLNGEELLAHGGRRQALPDQDGQLVRLAAGDNLLEVRLAADGAPELFVRCTGIDGLPVELD